MRCIKKVMQVEETVYEEKVKSDIYCPLIINEALIVTGEMPAHIQREVSRHLHN